MRRRRTFIGFTPVEWRAIAERQALAASVHPEGSAERAEHLRLAAFAEANVGRSRQLSTSKGYAILELGGE